MSNRINSVDEARYIVIQKYPDMRPVTVFQYDNLYVFSLVYKNRPDENAMDSMVAVNKTNGEIFTFLPIMYDSEKYIESVRNTLVKL